MIKLKTIFLIIISFSLSASGQELAVQKWLVSGTPAVTEPLFISGPDLQGDKFETKNLVTDSYIDIFSLKPGEGEIFDWPSETGLKWKIIPCDQDGFINISHPGKDIKRVVYLASYIESTGLINARVEVESPQMFEVYINGDKISSNYTTGEEGKTVKRSGSKELEPGRYLLVIKSLYDAGENSEWRLKAQLKDADESRLALTTGINEKMTIHHLLEGPKLGSINISPDGSLASINYSEVDTKSGKSNSWTIIRELNSGRILQSFRKEKTTGFRWAPVGKKLYYTETGENGSTVWIFDFETGREYPVIKNVAEMSGFRWSPDGRFIIYNVRETKKRDSKSSLRYMDELGNRTFRAESANSLYMYDIASGNSRRLTFGEPGTSLNDISLNGRFLIFSTSKPNPTSRPFSLQSMYLMDLKKGEVKELWKDSRFSGYCQFSPDAKKILVSGGPDLFGEKGRNIGDNPIANNYDGQLYIYEINSGEIDPITRDFNPAVESAVWHPVDNRIYISVSDQVYGRLYVYNPASGRFSNIPLEPDVMSGFDMSTGVLKAVYTGTSKFEYNRGWLLDIASGKSTLIENPEAETYKNVSFSKCEDWNFKMPDGKEITGYIIYPDNFDPSKKYPLIVNYYGGTSPVEKSFGGRYPHEIWSARGYLVYVPQPSGATGFGQEFSARHQNNWGKTVAGEIIEGTRQFLEAHPFADPDHVGCIGASYGGFMTMLLTTQTDIFTCAISHAGISSISSYWGEGYWGYIYSSEATGDSYPWNRRDIYVDQSPLFNADRINTPMLLLHGSSDTNVPLGESLQLWVGLKILGRPVEMVQVEGEDHHILTYSKRIEWHNTIMSWFDRWLKDNPGDWMKMFPESGK